MEKIYRELLSRVGLDDKEAETYETLLSLGKAGVKRLLPKVSLKRGSLYNALDGLKDKGLVVELIENKKKVWQVESPDKLQAVIKTNEQRLKEAEQSLLATLPTLKSNYNLTFNRPNVRFFEGEEGVKYVRNDSLNATEEIYTYIDNETVRRNIPIENAQHTLERTRRQIKKKMLVRESDWIMKNSESYKSAFTEIRVLSGLSTPFNTTMHIFNNKITYITYNNEVSIGVIIEDSAIYKMHRLLFEQNWNNAKPLSLYQASGAASSPKTLEL